MNPFLVALCAVLGLGGLWGAWEDFTAGHEMRYVVRQVALGVAGVAAVVAGVLE